MDKQQFDEFLGGDHRLPRDVPIFKLASARATEIAELTHSLANPQQTKLVFQKLPTKMRRRVMSHNAKRMPRRLREAHTNQMLKAGLPAKTKTPSRKYRRRPRNLLDEYNRRQKKIYWLETHIWHAKRFKIIDKWGFKIPLHSNDRSFKANYRAVKDHCLIQDISYYTCIELNGPKNILVETLKCHCNPNALTFNAKCWMSGEREGSLTFFKKNEYPKSALGNVYFLWKANCNSQGNDSVESKTIWIWIHPASYNDIIKEIIASFNFVIQDNGNSKLTEIEKQLYMEDWNDVNTMPPMMKLFKDIKTPEYNNDSDCHMTILRNHLNRFRLKGPLALDVIIEALKIPNLKYDEMKKSIVEISNDDNGHQLINSSLENNVSQFEVEQDLRKMCPESNTSRNDTSASWFNKYYSEEGNIKAFRVQKDMLNAMKNQKPGNLPPNMVIGLTVLDPRFFFPSKRQKACSDLAYQSMLQKPPTLANNSSLWSNTFRSDVTKEFVPSYIINKLRSECLVPGTSNDWIFNEDVMCKVPILIIQKPGNSGSHGLNVRTDSFSCGIDIILPSAWAVPFWLAFIFRNAKPVGFRESTMIPFESLNLNTPDFYHPDTAAYKREAINTKVKLTEKYLRKPPKKRVNFINFCVPEPFFCQWDLLMEQWEHTSQFNVLRNHKKLNLLNEYCNSPKLSNIELLSNFESRNLLVPVKLTTVRRGRPQNFAAICVPTLQDLNQYKRDKKWCGPKQESAIDPFAKEKKNMRTQHKAFLKRLKKKRIRLCKTVEKKHSNLIVIKRLQRAIKLNIYECSKRHVQEQARLMARLYLPESRTARYASDRETIGYITQGDFCYSEAKGIGLGYVVLQPILDFIKQKQNLVLIRNTQSKYFRFAKIEIIC